MGSASDDASGQGDQPVIAAASALPDRKDLAAFAVEHTRMPMVVSDPRLPDNPIVFVNSAFLEQTGYDAGEVIGRNCRFLQGSGTDPAAVDEIRDAVRTVLQLTIELLNYRKDGLPFWNQLHISPLHGPDGELLYFFASQMDVTEQRRTRALEKAEHALLLEVDHRAKNALALVQGIVRLSDRQEGTDAYADAVGGRIDALAVAHGLLSDARWHNIALGSLVKALVRALREDRFELAGEGPLLSPDQVQPLAVALHELLVNTVRPGGMRRDARCSVDWSSDAYRIVISVADRGGQTPKQAQPATFGARIVEQVVKRQLRGQVSNAWTPDGLVTTLTFPAQVT